MDLTAFMAENHTKVYSGYEYQPTIALMSALLIGWKRVENKDINLDHLKRRPNQLINCSFNLIDTLKKIPKALENLRTFNFSGNFLSNSKERSQNILHGSTYNYMPVKAGNLRLRRRFALHKHKTLKRNN